MDDNAILDLYFARSEQAISETDRKYGRYCYSIANHILSSPSDAEESVNDTYFAAWKLIPPRRPQRFGPFLGKLTRNLSIDRWRKNTAEKRGGREMQLLRQRQFLAGHGLYLPGGPGLRGRIYPRRPALESTGQL